MSSGGEAQREKESENPKQVFTPSTKPGMGLDVTTLRSRPDLKQRA